jgi:engulfment and cell motility protein 1
MSSHASDELRSSILDFQANMIKVAFRKKNTFVDPEIDVAHRDTLDFIWSASKLGHKYDLDEQNVPIKWRLLGFESEDMMQEFSEVGVLGLDCLVSRE